MKKVILLAVLLSMAVPAGAVTVVTPVKHPILQKVMWDMMTPVRWTTSHLRMAGTALHPYSGFVEPAK